MSRGQQDAARGCGSPSPPPGDSGEMVRLARTGPPGGTAQTSSQGAHEELLGTLGPVHETSMSVIQPAVLSVEAQGPVVAVDHPQPHAQEAVLTLHLGADIDKRGADAPPPIS